MDSGLHKLINTLLELFQLQIILIIRLVQMDYFSLLKLGFVLL